MSDRYLANEARWARQQALEAEHKIEELRDPFALEKLRQATSLELTQLKFKHRSEIHAVKARISQLTDSLDDHVDRLERDRRYWIELAEGHESRLAGSDDADLFGEATA
jgi:hypothetical protein